MLSGSVIVRALMWGVPALTLTHEAEAAELLLAQPSACAVGEELSFRAERALGEPLASAAAVRCTIHIERTPGAFFARLDVASMARSEAPRRREFAAADCEQLTDTLALAVVLAIGTGREPAEPARTEGEALPPNAASDGVFRAHSSDIPPSADEPAPESLEGPKREHGLHAAVAAALAMDVGTLPEPGVGAVLGLALGGDAIEFRGLGTYLLPRAGAADAPGAPRVGAELALAAGSLLGCLPRLGQLSHVTLAACAGVELGWLWGNGTGVSRARSGGVFWPAARADLAGRWGFDGGPLGLEVSTGLLVPFERDEFAVFDGSDWRVVHRPPSLVGRVSLGVTFELGSR